MKKLFLMFSIFFAFLFLTSAIYFYISLRKIEDEFIATAITFLAGSIITALGFATATRSWHESKNKEIN